MARPTARGVRAKAQMQVVDQFPSAAGGEDWVLCARARWLATRVAWVSSAECQVAHGTVEWNRPWGHARARDCGLGAPSVEYGVLG